jgi:CheY-like chemotaxis protein
MPSSRASNCCQPAPEPAERLETLVDCISDIAAPGATTVRPTAPRFRGAANGEASLSILYAEDDVMNQLLVEALAEDLGHKITVVADGAEALEQLEAAPFDLLLIDMQMPVMDGLTATRELRRRELAAGAPRLPVIMLTANSMPEDVAAALAAGVDRHVAKPITAQQLKWAIVETLRSAAD